MPWYRVQDNQNRNWEINSEGVARIVRSFVYHQALLARSRRVVHHHGNWLNPYPDTVAYETNFSGIVAHVDAEAARWMREAWVQANLNGQGLFTSLVDLRNQGVSDGETFHRNSLQASSESQQNINRVVDTTQAVVTGLTHVRNTSASILLAGATVVSGGTATALVAAAGAGIRFTSRIEDGGTVGQAAMETGIDLVVMTVTRGAGRSLEVSGANMSSRSVQATMALLGVVMNTGGDLAKTAVTGEVGASPLRGLSARLGAETVNGLTASLLTRGIPFLRVIPASTATQARDAIVSATVSFVGDRLVDAARNSGAARSNNAARGSSNIPANALLVASPALAQAEAFVRSEAMRPA